MADFSICCVVFYEFINVMSSSSTAANGRWGVGLLDCSSSTGIWRASSQAGCLGESNGVTSENVKIYLVTWVYANTGNCCKNILVA